MSRRVNVLAAAVGLSALGDFLALVPLALHIEDSTGSGFAVSALFVALWAPSILLAGPAGLLVDRVGPRRVLLTTSAFQVAVAVSLAFADGTLLMLGLAALLGAGNALAQPAEFALLPRVAGTSDVAAANGRLESARYIGFTLGPIIGALAAASGGTKGALLADAATFAVIGLAAFVLREQAGTRVEEAGGRARDGIAFLRRDEVLRGILPVAVGSLMVMTAVWTAEVFFAKDVLDAGEVGYGALMSLWTVGMVLGATVVAGRVGIRASVVFGAIAVQGLAIALPAAWPVFVFALAVFVMGGVAHGTKNVVLRTLIHERTPEHLHGRAFAAYNAMRNSAELAALAIGGVLVTALGPQATVAIAGTVPVLMVAVAVPVLRRRRPAAAPLPATAGAVA